MAGEVIAGAGRRCLAVYVLGDCPGCEAARWVAAEVAASRPEVEVRLVDLADPGACRPAAVFAVPTYRLDGRTIALGNPDPAALRAQLAGEAPGSRVEESGGEESSRGPWRLMPNG